MKYLGGKICLYLKALVKCTVLFTVCEECKMFSVFLRDVSAMHTKNFKNVHALWVSKSIHLSQHKFYWRNKEHAQRLVEKYVQVSVVHKRKEAKNNP